MSQLRFLLVAGLGILLIFSVASAGTDINERLNEGEIRPCLDKKNFQDEFTKAQGVNLYEVKGWDNDVTRGDGLDPSPDDNILYNGGFEAAVKNGGLAGWTVEFRDGAKGKVEWDQTYSRNGSASLKITKENGLGYIIVLSTKSLPCSRGDKLAFQGYYHTHDAPFPNLAMIRFVESDGDLSYTKIASMNRGTNGSDILNDCVNAPIGRWERKLTHAAISDPENVRIAIILYGNPMTIWWDDLSVDSSDAAKSRWKQKKPSIESRPDEFRIPEQISSDELAHRLTTDVEHTAKVVTTNAQSVLLIDGKPYPWVIYRPSLPAKDYPQGMEFQKRGMTLHNMFVHISEFYEKGVKDGKLYQIAREGMWKPDGTYDIESALNTVEKHLRNAPDSLFVLSVHFHPPAEWVERNIPDEAWTDSSGRIAYGTRTELHTYKNHDGTVDLRQPKRFWASYHSPKANDEMERIFRVFLNELKDRGYSKRIVGLHVQGGIDQQFGVGRLDYGKGALAAFRTWLKHKYATEHNLNKAWGSKGLTFDTVSIPGMNGIADSFLCPASHQAEIDYMMFFKAGPFGVNERYANVFREVMGKDVVVARFCLSPFNGTLMGSWDITPFNYSDTVDIIIPQPSYIGRNPGRIMPITLPVTSFRLNKKALVYEFDLRAYPYATPSEDEVLSGWVGRAESPAMWPTINRKAVGMQIANNFGYWYYDINLGAYYEKSVLDEMGESFKYHKRNLEKSLACDTSWKPDVAVVIDENSFFYVNVTRNGRFEPVSKTRWNQMLLIANSGVPYDVLLFDDLVKHKEQTQDYKVYVFLTSYHADKSKREVYKSLKRDGKYMVWMYAGGYVSQEGTSLKNIENLTGFQVGFDDKPSLHEVYAVYSHGLSKGIPYLHGMDIFDRVARRLGKPVDSRADDYPRFYIEDSKAEILAQYHDAKAAIAVKTFDDWTSVYVCPPEGLSSELFNNIARDAGAYVCSEPGNNIYVKDNFMSIHGVKPGYYTINLPQRGTVVNVKTGEIIARDTEKFQMFINAQSTYWLEIE